MSLTLYRAKRDFKKTAEPKGKRERTAMNIFVVQKHHASHLHYDFRLELDGVLKSWAVPKGPSLDPKQKRLAVEVEDHPIGYADFEGEIPKGEYGGGHVIVWDNGYWEPPKDALAQLKKGRLEFALHGEKLKGKFVLIRTRGMGGKQKSWLLIKRTDADAASPGDAELVDERPESVLSNRTVEDVEAGKPANKKSARRKSSQKTNKAKARAAKPVVKRVRKAPLPEAIVPQLARLSEFPPQGAEWIHEIKLDGYRTLARIENGKVKLLTRSGLDWTDKYPEVSASLKKLRIKSAVLDGEIVALDGKNRSRFQELQKVLKSDSDSPLIFYVFDLLHLNGEDTAALPLLERKARLEALLKKVPTDHIRYSEHWSEDAKSILKASCALELEGIISKRADQPYEPGRGDDWLKSKCKKGQEFVIGGYTSPQGSRTGFGALLLGTYNSEKEFIYAGRVGTGFDEKLLREILSKLKLLKAKQSPFADFDSRSVNIHWVEPELVCNIEFGEWTSDGHLRHPVFQGLRFDKAAKKVVVEKAPEADLKKTKAKKSKSKAVSKSITLTHPEKILFKDAGVSKQRLADFYSNISKWILPHIKDRPLAILRCPNGADGQCFFQKHQETDEVGIRSEKVRSKDRKETTDIMYVDDVNGLIELSQIGALELHGWGSRRENIDRADQIVFDFDPAEDVSFKDVVKGALELREILNGLKLKSFVKVTGGKGLHVQVPIRADYDWNQIKTFSKAVVTHLANKHPDRYLTKSTIAKRKGKIFLDYLRNGYGATAVLPYSLRAKSSAPVALPVAWDELKKIKNPSQFTLAKVEALLKKRKTDPWAGYLKLRQKIGILEKAKRNEGQDLIDAGLNA